MTEAVPHGTRLNPWGLLLLVFLFGAGGVVTYVGIQDRALPSGPPGPSAAPESLPLPQDEPAIPPGPNREQFATACITCHSTRLIMNQPPLTEAQWTASVRKMVSAYGAVIPPPLEKEIVAYLVALQQRDKDTP